jgi:hypothetical protein
MENFITPVGLIAAICDRNLGIVGAARLARTQTKVIRCLMEGEPVPLESLKRVCIAFGFEDPDPRPMNWRVETEWQMRDRVANELQQLGYIVDTEYRLPSGCLVDLVAWEGRRKFNVKTCLWDTIKERLAYIVEAKVTKEFCAIGQLMAYQIEIVVDAPMVLLVRSDCYGKMLQAVCDKVGIEIWVDKVRGKRAAFSEIA